MDIFSTVAVSRLVDTKLEKIFATLPDIGRFLKKHDRRVALEHALMRELRTADARKAIQTGPQHVDMIVEGVVKFWANNVLELEKNKTISINEARRRQEEATKEDRAKDIVRDIVPNIDGDEEFRTQEI